jgi:hypothetical protein
MTTRRNKKRKAAKKAARKSAAKKAAAKKAKPRKTAKTRGKTTARQRTPAPKASTTAKRGAERRLALLSVSGRRAKSLPSRGPARSRVGARPRIAKSAPAAPRVPGVAIRAPLGSRYTEVLTPAALRFLADLHREFEAGRERTAVQDEPSGGEEKLARDDRPTAQASDARMTMLDFADSRFARWANRIEGQISLKDRASRKRAADRIGASDDASFVIVCPRDRDTVEECLVVDGKPMSAALFDFGLCIFHTRNVEAMSRLGFCLSLLQTPEGARFWQDVFEFVQDRLGITGAVIHAKSGVEELLAELSG